MFLLAYIGAPPTIGFPAANSASCNRQSDDSYVTEQFDLHDNSLSVMSQGLGLSSTNAVNICVKRQIANRMHRMHPIPC